MLTALVATYEEPERLLRVMARAVAIVTILDMAMLAMPSWSYTEIGYRGLHCAEKSDRLACLHSCHFLRCSYLDASTFVAFPNLGGTAFP